MAKKLKVSQENLDHLTQLVNSRAYPKQLDTVTKMLDYVVKDHRKTYLIVTKTGSV